MRGGSENDNFHLHYVLKVSLRRQIGGAKKPSKHPFDHLICNQFSRKVVREIWFEKSGWPEGGFIP